jgi:transcriptional regulator with XRE-family HTH domain
MVRRWQTGAGTEPSSGFVSPGPPPMVDTTDIEEIREATREWLRDVLAQSGLSPYALAKRAGLAHTTVARFLNQDVNYTLKASTIAKIMRATGLAAPPSVRLGAHADSIDQELLIRAITAAFIFVEIGADEHLAREAANVAAELYARGIPRQKP